MTIRETYCSAYESADATIANGESLSGAIDLGGLRLFAIRIPSAWTTANLTFQGSIDGGATYNDLKDQDGVEITAVVSAVSDMIILDPVLFSAIPLLKIRSGTSASAVNQGGARTLTLVLRSI